MLSAPAGRDAVERSVLCKTVSPGPDTVQSLQPEACLCRRRLETASHGNHTARTAKHHTSQLQESEGAAGDVGCNSEKLGLLLVQVPAIHGSLPGSPLAAEL